MFRASMIREIVMLQGKDANPEWLATRTDQQLWETLQRWRAISIVTQDEIDKHCNTDFLERKK